MTAAAADPEQQPQGKRVRMLTMSVVAFTMCFATWTIFSILGVQIQQELGLSETQLGFLLATPVLTGSVSRIFLGILSERFGGRVLTFWTMIIAAGCTWLLAYATAYWMFLLAGLGLGLAGGTFITGIAFTARWFPKHQQGTALGVFGIGNAGAGVTNFVAPMIMVAVGWETTAQLYATAMLVIAVIFWLVTETDPTTAERRKTGAKAASLATQLAPLRYLQVWRFGLYYFFVFGGFVALASWLPRYYTGVYDLDVGTAGMLAAIYSLSASVFRAVGGWMSDRWGARFVMYLTFSVALVCLFILSYPPTHYRIEGVDTDISFFFALDTATFTIIALVLGFVMSLGKAAVYKHIPVYYPETVGSVGGLVGMIGGLGGFVLPPIFGALIDVTNVWTTPFMALFALVGVNLLWMHFAIQRMERKTYPELGQLRDLPEGIRPGQEPWRKRWQKAEAARR